MASPKRKPDAAGAARYGPGRLGALYEVSKLLTHFVETLEATVLALLAIITEELPLRSVIVVDGSTDEPRSVVWHAPTVGADARREAEARARTALLSLTARAAPQDRGDGEGAASDRPARGRFLTLPLVVEGRPIFGVIHVEGVEPFVEEDVAFVSAVADQLAIALNLYHARLDERTLRKQAQASRRRAERELAGRRHVEEEVRRLNEDLERRIAERTGQFEDTIKELHAFTYSIAHDLRAPLRHIHGFSRLLLESADDAACDEYAKRIMSATADMDALIKDLLAYSRLTLDEVVLEPVSLSPVMARIKGAMEDELRARGGRLDIEEPLPRVVGHEVVLGQALANLVSNALKFTAPGVAPRVRVSAEPRGASVRLWVEDNGIGIAPEHQERVFGMFQRLHRAEDYPGTGIGLAIVRRALERMKGRVGVESQPGKGSRFWIELPKADAEP